MLGVPRAEIWTENHRFLKEQLKIQIFGNENLTHEMEEILNKWKNLLVLDNNNFWLEKVSGYPSQ